MNAEELEQAFALSQQQIQALRDSNFALPLLATYIRERYHKLRAEHPDGRTTKIQVANRSMCIDQAKAKCLLDTRKIASSLGLDRVIRAPSPTIGTNELGVFAKVPIRAGELVTCYAADVVIHVAESKQNAALFSPEWRACFDLETHKKAIREGLDTLLRANADFALHSHRDIPSDPSCLGQFVNDAFVGPVAFMTKEEYMAQQHNANCCYTRLEDGLMVVIQATKEIEKGHELRMTTEAKNKEPKAACAQAHTVVITPNMATPEYLRSLVVAKFEQNAHSDPTHALVTHYVHADTAKVDTQQIVDVFKYVADKACLLAETVLCKAVTIHATPNRELAVAIPAVKKSSSSSQTSQQETALQVAKSVVSIAKSSGGSSSSSVFGACHLGTAPQSSSTASQTSLCDGMSDTEVAILLKLKQTINNVSVGGCVIDCDETAVCALKKALSLFTATSATIPKVGGTLSVDAEQKQPNAPVTVSSSLTQDLPISMTNEGSSMTNEGLSMANEASSNNTCTVVHKCSVCSSH